MLDVSSTTSGPVHAPQLACVQRVDVSVGASAALFFLGDMSIFDVSRRLSLILTVFAAAVPNVLQAPIGAAP